MEDQMNQMNYFFTLGGTFLLVVFLIAGTSKLGQAGATSDTAKAFGVPERFAPLVGLWLPYIELGIATLMLLPTAATFGFLAATVILSAFSLAIAVALARGNKPSCNCFGQASSAPIGWWTLVRNGALLALSVWILATGEAQLGSGLLVAWGDVLAKVSVAGVALIALGLVVTIQAWFISKMLTQQGKLLLRLDNVENRLEAAGIARSTGTVIDTLKPGDTAPTFALKKLGIAREPSLSEYFGLGTRTALLFVDSNCSPCHEVLDVLDREPPLDIRLLVVVNEAVGMEKQMISRYPNSSFAFPVGNSAVEAYGVVGTPSLVLVDDGIIASHVAIGSAAIYALLRLSASREQPRDTRLSVV